jgi:hypothetical protein
MMQRQIEQKRANISKIQEKLEHFKNELQKLKNGES